ncbi:hypothetical protein [Allosphingosinicella deserti]|uniref:hypothetical protein n=1 Tax=Allosphingosinicella deserti TaxID=2116704 RepID=UPI001304D49C|nr:hypothetical protein [Sphingomonas deserti]
MRRRRYALLTEAVPVGRGARFGRRIGTQPGPSYGDLAKIPDWLSEPEARRQRIAALAGLLRYRRAIDAELSGPKLATIAELLGEDLFDAACDADADADGPASLPPPERILDEGRGLLEAALPRSLAAAFPGARDDDQARRLVLRAHAIERALA